MPCSSSTVINDGLRGLCDWSAGYVHCEVFLLQHPIFAHVFIPIHRHWRSRHGGQSPLLLTVSAVGVFSVMAFSPSSTAHSHPDPDSSKLPRTRSVQFSTPHTSMSRSISPTDRSYQQQQQQQTESSADEITPMVGKERGGAKNKNYDATRSIIDNGVGHSRQSSISSARRRRPPSTEAASTVAEVADRKEKGGWWKDMVDKFGSVELDNKGSVARDHLALGPSYPPPSGIRSITPALHLSHPAVSNNPPERTFLAWLRTSLAFASIGIAITQLFRLNTTISEREGYEPKNPPNTYHLRQVGKPLGATFLGIAVLVLLAGGRRYFESQVRVLLRMERGEVVRSSR